MIRARTPLMLFWLFIPCLACGLLLAPRPAQAQIVVTGSASPRNAALNDWFSRHVPARFCPVAPLKIHLLMQSELAAYLQGEDSGDAPDQNSHADDGGIDGIFEDDPPRIALLIPDTGNPDMFTFAHEYGHFVWFHLLTSNDRLRYAEIYHAQKDAHHLVTRYAETDVEEGFAEAFSFYAAVPPLLRHRDPASAQFLTQWAAPHTAP